MARIAKSVTGIELSKEMVERGYENAKHNDIDNVEFYASDLFESNKEGVWLNKKYTKALIDPPRSGAKEILPRLAKMGINHLVYISCNPATLARDTKTLVHECGYKLKAAGILDMFPQTKHVESIAVFRK